MTVSTATRLRAILIKAQSATWLAGIPGAQHAGVTSATRLVTSYLQRRNFGPDVDSAAEVRKLGQRIRERASATQGAHYQGMMRVVELLTDES